VNPHDPRYSVVDSFVKDEFYTEPKHARVINSRSDEFKTLVAENRVQTPDGLCRGEQRGVRRHSLA